MEKLVQHTHKIFKSKAFKDFVEQHTGINNLQITPTTGSWQGEVEPSYVIHGDNMSPDGTRKLRGMLGFGFGQDAVVHAHHNPDIEQGIPTAYIGHGRKLSAKDIDNIHQASKEHGLDFSIAKNQDAAYFKHFGDASEMPDFFQKVKNIADKTGMPDRLHVRSESDLIDAKEYLHDAFGSGGEGVRFPANAKRSPELFRGIVNNILAPYAKAVSQEGYRLSPERIGEHYGLSPEEVGMIRDGMYPRQQDDRSTVGLMTGKDKLDVRPTGARGDASVNDILYALQNKATAKGQIDPEDRSDRAKNLIANTMADEVNHHVKTSDKSAIGWYDEALKKAKDKYAQIFPEIKTDKDKAMLFDAVLGITSQGNDVHSNSIMASRIYNLVRDGKMSLADATNKLKGSFGKETNAIEGNLLKFHNLIEKNGYDKMRDVFNTKMTVSDWRKRLKTDQSLTGLSGETLSVKGSANQKVTGWSVFGPKIGSFINNLHGDYSTLTADLWFSRTWNRMLGHNFIHTPLTEAKQYQDYRDAFKAEWDHHNDPTSNQMPKMSGGKPVLKNGEKQPWLHGQDLKDMPREEFERIYNDPEELLKHANKTHGVYSSPNPITKASAYHEKSDLRRRAKNWIENRENSVAAPRNDTERNFQQATAEQAQNVLKKKYGVDISVADIQAALWFHEKELLGKFGGTNEKAKPADYADAATRAVDLHKSGKLYMSMEAIDKMEADKKRVEKEAAKSAAKAEKERLKAETKAKPPEQGYAEGGDIMDDSRVKRTGEGGQETALDFIQNAPLYKQRIEDQKQSQPQDAPAPAPQTESKPMPVIAAPPPAIIRAAEPAPPAPVQQQPQAQGQTGLFHIGTNDTDPNLTVKSAQRIIDASRTMGINPVFLLPNQSVKKPYAETSKALQKYLDDNGIQYHMPEYEPGDPAHMSHEWVNNFAKTYNNPFIAGDSNSVRLGTWGYGAKGTALVHPDSKAVLGRVGAGSKAIADELEKHVKWYQQNAPQQRSNGGEVDHRVHFPSLNAVYD
jgi:hypothetical protein